MTATAPDMASSENASSSIRSAQSSQPGQRRNIALLGVDMAIFSMGLGALGEMTVIPLFVSELTDSPLAVGAVALTAPSATWLLLAVPMLGTGARAPSRAAA